jgi:23S rRNA A2030 N6-methylase RlmJ
MLAGLPVTAEAVEELDALVRVAGAVELADRLELALDNQVKLLALSLDLDTIVLVSALLPLSRQRPLLERALTEHPIRLQLVASDVGVGRLRREVALRADDRITCCELQPEEAQSLQATFARDPRVAVHERDGYAALKALLPPKIGTTKFARGLVLIDPPYESEAEFDAVLAALMHGHERWPTGMYCVWYPQTERAGSLRFHRELCESGIRRILDAQLSVLPPDSAVGMQGCGLAIVNPPWQLDLRLTQLLPELHALLAPDGAGGTRVDWLVPE